MKQVIAILFILTIAACNPVKQAFKPKHIEKTKEEFFRRNLCIVDTQTKIVTVHDSVVYKDTVKLVEFQKILPKSFNLDTTIDGSKIKISNGSISIELKEKVKTEYKTNTITKILRDIGFEQSLKKTISARDSVLLQTKNELVEVKGKYYKYKSIIIGLGLLLVLLITWRLYRIFKL